MSNYLYGRKYQILVAKSDGSALDVSNLRCVFRVEKVALSIANYSELSIYNLSPELDASILKEYDRVIINAGYQGYLTPNTDSTTATETASAKQYGKIFDGQIIQVLRDRENVVDYKMTLICSDGDNFLNNSIIKMTLNAGINQRQIIENVASKATTPTEIGKISPDLNTQRLPRGKVFFGTPKKYLRDIAADNNASFWVDDGQVVVTKSTDVSTGQALVITPDNGLLEVPQQVQEGISFKCLLNPNIKLMTMVKLDNTVIRQMKQQVGQIPLMLDRDGQYQAYKVIHEGDTRGNNWYTNVVGISRYGKIPIMLSNAAQNPN